VSSRPEQLVRFLHELRSGGTRFVFNPRVLAPNQATTKKRSSRPEQPDAFSSRSFLERVGLRSGGILA